MIFAVKDIFGTYALLRVYPSSGKLLDSLDDPSVKYVQSL